MQIALTYDCHCSCVHCAAAPYRRDRASELTADEVYALIEDAYRLGVHEIYFFGGEPLLSPMIFDYTAHAKRFGMVTRVDTNGYMLDETMVDRLKEAGMDHICVSLDTPVPEDHDRLRNTPGLFSKAVHGIRYSIAKGIKRITISSYVTKTGLRDGTVQGMVALAKELGVELQLLAPIRSGRWQERRDVVLDAEDTRILRTFLDPRNKIYWESLLVNNPDSDFVCQSNTRQFFYVSAFGDILLCCFLPTSFGNVREEPLEVIVRRMWTAGILPAMKGSGCPLNTEHFWERYGDRIGFDEGRPKRFSGDSNPEIKRDAE